MKVEIDYGRGAIADLKKACYRELIKLTAQDYGIPVSCRGIYYRLDGDPAREACGAPDRSEGKKAQDQYISRAIMWLREEGHIPWEWIKDETRSLWEPPDFADSRTAALGGAACSLNAWANRQPLIICEARSVGGPIATHTREWSVPMFSTNGQAHGALMTDVVPWLGDHPDSPVFYVGDWNKPGFDIEANTMRILESQRGPLDWTRIALTDEQVHDNDLAIQQKRQGPSVECEAFGHDRIIGLIIDKLADLYPEDIEETQAREERQRKQVQEHLAKLKLVD